MNINKKISILKFLTSNFFNNFLISYSIISKYRMGIAHNNLGNY